MSSSQNNQNFSSLSFIGGGFLILLLVLLVLVYFRESIASFQPDKLLKSDPFQGQMVAIPAGSFMMGTEGGNAYEKPVHEVAVKAFQIAKFEVTQKQWAAIMDNNPSSFTDCEDCPVETVSWDEIQIFLRKLNEISHKNYRLPTEEEWEYAAYLGEKYPQTKPKFSEIAWYKENSEEKTHIVGRKQANTIGLYDMSGNVWEWCNDWYDEKAYENAKKPAYKAPQNYKSLRGGSWYSQNYECRISNRYFLNPKGTDVNAGFRVAL